MEKDKNLSINLNIKINRNKLILTIVLLIGVLIAVRCYNVKDYIGEWEGTYVNQYSDGTKGLVPGKTIDNYIVKINFWGVVEIENYWGLFEQKEKNGLYTESFSNKSNLSGYLLKKHGKTYLKYNESDNKKIAELEWINYNKINMILSDHEVSLTK